MNVHNNHILKKIKILNINLNNFKNKNKLKIVKNNICTKVDVQILPKFVKADDETFKGEVEKAIKYFTTILINNCNNINLDNFINKFKTVKIMLNQLESDEKIDGIRTGAYNVAKNEIYINDFSCIYHELMHLSSTSFKYSYIVSGFALFDLNNSRINNYFNEGYTQLLTERYFDDKDKGKIYTFAVLVSSEIEKIIGKNKMEELYFNSDFVGLVNELEKYETTENIVEFFGALEFFEITNNFKMDKNIVKITNVDDELIDKNMIIISDFLYNCQKKIEKNNVKKKINQ